MKLTYNKYLNRMNSELNIIQYTEKSFVVRGNTNENKEQLKNIGGKYNALLKGGPGWIFPNFLKKNVEEYIKSGTITTNFSKEEKTEYKNKNIVNENSLLKRIEALEDQVKILVDKLGLENKYNISRKQKNEEILEFDDEEEEENYEIPRKSFLTKNKK
jgi:hypothetical protein